MNAVLPQGSYVTVEWPTNFGGINNLYYTRGEHDYLFDKSQVVKQREEREWEGGGGRGEKRILRHMWNPLLNQYLSSFYYLRNLTIEET